MSYSEFIKDPILVAVVSSLIGLFLSLCYNKWKSFNDRIAALNILKHQLENQKNQLDVLQSNLSKNYVLGGLDSFYIKLFINGSYVDISKDESLLRLLYEHLDNIELIKNALHRINLFSAGFTDVQIANKQELENNLKIAIADCKATVRKCLSEI